MTSALPSPSKSPRPTIFQFVSAMVGMNAEVETVRPFISQPMFWPVLLLRSRRSPFASASKSPKDEPDDAKTRPLTRPKLLSVSTGWTDSEVRPPVPLLTLKTVRLRVPEFAANRNPPSFDSASGARLKPPGAEWRSGHIGQRRGRAAARDLEYPYLAPSAVPRHCRPCRSRMGEVHRRGYCPGLPPRRGCPRQPLAHHSSVVKARS